MLASASASSSQPLLSSSWSSPPSCRCCRKKRRRRIDATPLPARPERRGGGGSNRSRRLNHGPGKVTPTTSCYQQFYNPFPAHATLPIPSPPTPLYAARHVCAHPRPPLTSQPFPSGFRQDPPTPPHNPRCASLPLFPFPLLRFTRFFLQLRNLPAFLFLLFTSSHVFPTFLLLLIFLLPSSDNIIFLSLYILFSSFYIYLFFLSFLISPTRSSYTYILPTYLVSHSPSFSHFSCSSSPSFSLSPIPSLSLLPLHLRQDPAGIVQTKAGGNIIKCQEKALMVALIITQFQAHISFPAARPCLASPPSSPSPLPRDSISSQPADSACLHFTPGGKLQYREKTRFPPLTDTQHAAAAAAAAGPRLPSPPITLLPIAELAARLTRVPIREGD